MKSAEPDKPAIVTRPVGANIPVDDLEFLRARAIRNGDSRADAAIVRDAVVEFAKRQRMIASAKTV